MRASILASIAAAALAVAAPAEEAKKGSECDGPSYDYIVVGSGPGGGPLAANLARAGFKTLLIEAGDDESGDIATQVAGLFASTGIHENLHWAFYVRHYDDDEQMKKFAHLTWTLPSGDLWVGPGSDAPEGAEMLGVNYPRGATLGGSSIINAGAVFLPPDSDWNHIAEITGDETWSGKHMRELFMKLEDNQYLPKGTPGHGFDGYFKTTIGTGEQYLASEHSVNVLQSMIKQLGKDPMNIEELITEDANYLSPKRDTTDGLWALPFHANNTFARYSARNRILDTLADPEEFPLKLQLNSLATRVLFDKTGKKPKAIGVEFLEGKSVYKGDPRYDPSNKGKLRTACAKKEVIVSGGAFNTPQLLMLSGIGAKEELEKFDIPVVVDLPGVGTNMQDNQEIGTFSLAAQDFFPPSECTFGNLPDPCYDLWLEGKGPYTQAGPNSNILLLTSSHSPNGERDLTVFSGPFAFRGFWPATPNQTWVEPLNTWGMHMVKNFPQNRAGYVRLASSDPTDMPEINFRLFSEGSEIDIAAMKEGIAWCRKALMGVEEPTGPMDITHPPCETVMKDGTCKDKDADEEWIRSDAFGHHVTSTCPIGADDDEMAVLDSQFRVRGVSGLRVVDASVFPRIPGSFPVVATFMVSEKASELILGTSKKGEMKDFNA